MGEGEGEGGGRGRNTVPTARSLMGHDLASYVCSCSGIIVSSNMALLVQHRPKPWPCLEPSQNSTCLHYSYVSICL